MTVSDQYLHRYDAKMHENCFAMAFCTPESCFHGLSSKCFDLF